MSNTPDFWQTVTGVITGASGTLLAVAVQKVTRRWRITLITVDKAASQKASAQKSKVAAIRSRDVFLAFSVAFAALFAILISPLFSPTITPTLLAFYAIASVVAVFGICHAMALMTWAVVARCTGRDDLVG